MTRLLAALATVLALTGALADDALPLLPKPAPRIPELPPLVPIVVTAGGQRRLLAETDVTVRWDPAAQRLVTNHPQWWVINYPLDRIQGLEGPSADEVARLLFGQPAAQVRNWYLRSPGEPGPEPPPATGPAPITPTPNPTLIVDGASPAAADTNPGTTAAPLKTIAAAVSRAKAGTVIHVRPGIYRESVTLAAPGTADAPIRLEALRDAQGRMPVISGNDPFPARAWAAVPGCPGVWRADLFTGQLGTVTVDGEALIERSVPGELKPGEYCLNRASREFLALRYDGGLDPREGDTADGRTWRKLAADGEGFLDLGAAFGPRARGAVMWASAWLWVPPLKQDVVWDPRFPQPVTDQVTCAGEFRAFRMTGADLKSQVNAYRLWVNGERLPSAVRSGLGRMEELDRPHPTRNYGFSDLWERFPLKEGWNHLVFQFDTTTRPDKLKFRLDAPKRAPQVISSAAAPADRAKADGTPKAWLSEALVLEPIPAPEADRGVYVRLPGDADPNTVAMDLSARVGPLVEVSGDFVQVRGFEVRDGAEFQQRAQLNASGAGDLIEGCLLRDSEVKGISVRYERDQSAAPIVVRGNWVLNPGNTGIGGSGSSEKLTAENQNTDVPGRSRVLIEHNLVVNPNWAGIEPFWESGGMKLFRLTGTVVRYNTIRGGSGPAIWLDWEHFNNRLEGNLFEQAWAFGIGVEASPGPDLLANNLSVDLRPGEVWFRYGLLSWSSDRNWALHNTIDGRWSKLPAWQNQDGADGIYLNEGRDDRQTRWGALTGRQDAVLNNLVLGCDVAVRARPTDIAGGNRTDKGRGAEAVDAGLRDPVGGDYRPRAGSPLVGAGVDHELLRLVTHDFYGLPRRPGEHTVGACRPDRPAMAPEMEWELADGKFERR